MFEYQNFNNLAKYFGVNLFVNFFVWLLKLEIILIIQLIELFLNIFILSLVLKFGNYGY